MKNQLLLGCLLFLLACGRPKQTIRYGAVSSASPEATKAGMSILEQGGNAVDAAIAVSFALTVSEPAMSGLGGGTQVQLYLPGESTPFAINGSTISPASTPHGFQRDSLTGHLRTTIPSTVKVMQYLYDHYGSHRLAWATLLQPAIDLAEQGFEMGTFRQKVYQRYEEKLAAGIPSTSDYYPVPADRNSQQEKIALALRLLAKDGAATFYQGKMAASIAADMSAKGGWISEQDLANFPEPKILPSIHFEHNGYDIYTQPEPCGGWVVKEILQKLTALREENSEKDPIHQLLTALHYGHEQRQQKAQEKTTAQTGETTHFSVMDAAGTSISVTASINAYYGAGVANPDYGFLYNSYMDDFNYEEADNKYAVGPNKMAYSSMSPTIVMKDKKVVLIIGSPGSARIISSVAQLIDAYTNSATPAEKLLYLPRVHAIDQKVYFENEQQELEFKAAGMTDWRIVKPSATLVQNGLNAYFGGVHAIVWTGKEYQAIADPRRDGLAILK